MIINHNMSAINANGKMAGNSVQTSKSMEKLSSGLRINRAGDDAAGLAISEKMRAQIRGLDQAERNAQDGISLIQTAEGGLSETHSILQRMRELATQASNGTNTDTDRQAMQDEINQLTSEVNRIGNTTEFNTQKILNGGIDQNTETTKTEGATSAKVTLGGNDKAATKTFAAAATAAIASTNATSGTMTRTAGKIADNVKIIVDGKEFNVGGTILYNQGSKADAEALGAVTAADGTKLSDVATIDTSTNPSELSIQSKTKGSLGSVQITADENSVLNANTKVDKKYGDGEAIIVDGVGFAMDLAATAFSASTSSMSDASKQNNIEALGNLKTADGKTKLSDLVDIGIDENGKFKLTSKSKGSDSTIQFQNKSSNVDVAGKITDLATTDVGEDNKVTGTGIKTKSEINKGNVTISLNVADGFTTSGTKASITGVTTVAGDIDKDTKIIVDGKVYTNKDAVTLSDTTTTGVTLAANAKSNGQIIGNSFVAEDGTKLGDVLKITADTTDGTLDFESKISGVNSSIIIPSEAELSSAHEQTSKGNGSAVVVNDKSFDISGVQIKTTDNEAKAKTIADLGAKTAADGTKLSDVMDLSFDGKKLIMSAKTGGSNTSVYFENRTNGGVSTDLAPLGLTTATLSSDNKVSGTDSTKVIIDNKTFDLGGIVIDRTNASTLEKSISSLKNTTSGGVKLSDLVDIKDVDGRLEFTSKSSGASSNITFTGNKEDLALGLSEDQLAAGKVTGEDTTVERAGLEGGKALNELGTVKLASNSTIKVSIAGGSDIEVNLNSTSTSKAYDVSNADKTVAKAEMDKLVSDINNSLQSAGLGGKLSASLSADNKLQFISEEGQNVQVKDGIGSPLTGTLGFSASDMTANKNIQQVVGSGAEGDGFKVDFQIGANKGQMISTSIKDMRAAALGITGNAGEQGFTSTTEVTNGTTSVKQEAAVNLMTSDSATKAIETINNAIVKVAAERGKLGSVQNRLEHTINNLGTSSENLTSAESRIRDVNMAKEMMSYQKNNVLSQAAQAMLAQANQQPQQVLSLLR